ncbi:MAG: hypothetical protein J0L87_03565 [Bacteroidetes bacterium]|nr:hypothetical protein [Bacteroidota bacterium]
MNDWPKEVSSIPAGKIQIRSTLLHPGKIHLLTQILQAYKNTENRTEREIWIYAFFDHAYHLKDWFKNFPLIANFDDRWKNYSGNLYFKLCRDFCNRNKHIKVTQPSISSNVRLMRMIENDIEQHYITYDNKYMPAEFLMTEVLKFWKDFERTEL